MTAQTYFAAGIVKNAGAVRIEETRLLRFFENSAFAQNTNDLNLHYSREGCCTPHMLYSL